jgi:hypothetical protein
MPCAKCALQWWYLNPISSGFLSESPSELPVLYGICNCQQHVKSHTIRPQRMHSFIEGMRSFFCHSLQIFPGMIEEMMAFDRFFTYPNDSICYLRFSCIACFHLWKLKHFVSSTIPEFGLTFLRWLSWKIRLTILEGRLLILKTGMSASTNSLHRYVAEVTNFEDPEE